MCSGEYRRIRSKKRDEDSEALDEENLILYARTKSVHQRKLFIYTTNRLTHVYTYVQSRIIILRQHISVSSLTIVRVSYKNNKINTLIRVQKCMVKPLNVTLNFL
jgi:hypothetical protein